MINIAIIDDHKIVADGLEYLVNKSDTVRVIGKAYSVAGCWELLRREHPEVLLLDISMPDGNGVDLCAEIKEKYPELKIIMLTSYSELTTINRAIDAGASGYALKNSMAEEIIEGVCTVAGGEQFLCEEVNLLMKKQEKHPTRLSRREQELLRLIVAGYSNNEIADSMCLGYETIKSYRKNLILKLNAHNTAALVKMAIEQQLV